MEVYGEFDIATRFSKKCCIEQYFTQSSGRTNISTLQLRETFFTWPAKKDKGTQGLFNQKV
jgi:hypothetical protein